MFSLSGNPFLKVYGQLIRWRKETNHWYSRVYWCCDRCPRCQDYNSNSAPVCCSTNSRWVIPVVFAITSNRWASGAVPPRQRSLTTATSRERNRTAIARSYGRRPPAPRRTRPGCRWAPQTRTHWPARSVAWYLSICVAMCYKVKLCAIRAHPIAPFRPNYLGEKIYSGDPGFGALLVRGF